MFLLEYEEKYQAWTAYYENFVRQISGEPHFRTGEALKESVERDKRRQALQK